MSEDNAPRKRASERQLTDRDDVDDDVGDETGTFKEASAEEISKRKIVSVRRKPAAGVDNGGPKPAGSWSFTATPAAAAPVPAATESKPEATKETTPASPVKEATPAAAVSASPVKEAAPTTNTATTPSRENGAETKAATPAKEETKTETAAGTPEAKPAPFTFAPFTANTTFPSFPAFPSFSFTQPNPLGGAGIFGQNIAPPKPKEGSDDEGGEDPTIPEPEPAGPPTVLPLVPVVTGEEDETTLHSVRGKLFHVEDNKYKDRGVGQLKLNKNKDGRIRIIMRDQGGKHLRLNVAIFPQMVVDRVSDTQVRFFAFEGGAKLMTFLVKVARKDEATELYDALQTNKATAHVGSTAANPAPAAAAAPAATSETPVAEKHST